MTTRFIGTNFTAKPPTSPSPRSGGPLSRDAATRQAKQEWTGMSAADRRSWKDEATFVACRRTELTGQLRRSNGDGGTGRYTVTPDANGNRVATDRSGKAHTLTPPCTSEQQAEAQARREWQAMGPAERSKWASEKTYVGYRKVEARRRK